MNALSDKYRFDIIKDGGAAQKKAAIMPAFRQEIKATRKYGMSSLTFEVSPTRLTNPQSKLHYVPTAPLRFLRLKGRFFLPFNRLLVL